MKIAFAIAALIAVLSTISVITGRNAIHALLSLVLSLLSVAVIFFLLGAPLAAALEVIIYAGAIMVLFVFAIMMMNLGKQAARDAKVGPRLSIWIFPGTLTLLLFFVFFYVILMARALPATLSLIGPKAVGLRLFGSYLCLVELAAVLLLVGLLGAYHLGKNTAVEDLPERSVS